MRGGAGTELTEPGAGAIARRWGALLAYVVAVYAFLPYGPRLGLALARTAPGGWLLGPGVLVCTAVGVAVLFLVMWRRAAPAWAWVAIGVAGVAYAVAFSWLRSRHLERTHLPEYGVVAWLAWRALVPLVPSTAAAYLGAAALGAAVGYGDELLQLVVPGRVYDVRDVAMNALGAVLGIVVLASARSTTLPPTPDQDEPAASDAAASGPSPAAAGEGAGAGGRAERL